MTKKWYKHFGYSMFAASLLCSIVTNATPPSIVKAEDVKQEGRHENKRSINFNKDWKFALVNPKGITDPSGQFESAYERNYDDTSWRKLDVPHDWSIEQKPTATAPATAGTGFLDGGLGWYRKSFTLPQSMKDKKISIDFDGVYMDSSIYINGELAGNHPYGYTGFSIDLADKVFTDGKTPNVIAVKVQNPLPTSRWYSGSGIYRNVHLTVTEDTHVNRWGTFVTTPDLETTIKKGYANVHVKTDVIRGDETKSVQLLSTIKDTKGQVVGHSSETAAPDNKDGIFETEIKVDNPTLWSIDTPSLYKLETEVVVDRKVVDRYTTPFGIRYFKFDPNLGFSLNGKDMKLQGVNLHHDLGALGSATNYDAVVRQLKIMKSMGVNALRTSHNPPSPEVYEACNTLGIVMIVEAFDMWENKKTTNDYSRYFKQYSDTDIKEMVNSAKNWPAVVSYSIGNEIPESTQAKGIPIAQRLIDDVKSIDLTRPVTIGSDKYRKAPSNGSAADQIARKVDALGLNYNNASSLDALHVNYPNLTLFESESSSETSTRGYYESPDSLNTARNFTPGLRSTSSYDNNLESWTFSGEYGLKKDRDRKYFAGQFLWTGIDYLGEPTPYWSDFPVKSSFFGAVDTAGFPKDAYYLYKSQWSKEPMVHLLPMNWTDYKPGEEVQVWAYSNVDTVELFLNGKSLGKKKFDTKTTVDGRSYLETTEASGDDKTVTTGSFPGSYTSPNDSAGKLHLTWEVPFSPGKLVAVATKDGKELARDEIETAKEAYTLKLTPDKKVINADGKSLSFITVDVVDKNGVVVPDADNLIHFNVKGGKLAGVDNGRQESAESYKSDQREAFNGKALAIIQSSEDEGPITITASASGLQPATTTVYSAAEHENKAELIALEPVYGRVSAGSTLQLPESVQGIYTDGSLKSFSVEWKPEKDMNKPGVYYVIGKVKGTDKKAKAMITVYTLSAIQSYSTVVPIGTAPVLPATARVVYTDGQEEEKPVKWDKISTELYAKEGEFAVIGTVADTNEKATAHIRVTGEFKENANLALVSSPLKPTATASFSGATNTLPDALIDGNKSSGGWSNLYNVSATANLPGMSGARSNDFVAIKWPNPQSFGTMNMYFTTDAKNSLPASVDVTYWNGQSFEPVSNLKINWSSSTNEASTISFDPISTSQVRVNMSSKAPASSTGNITIREIEIFGKETVSFTEATLDDLKVNGKSIQGFDSEKTAYAIKAGKTNPVISAYPGKNGRITIQNPTDIPGTGKVTVISEDGFSEKTYTLNFMK